ncbi:hypothetical protein ACQJBY_000220 [Aegilops geniculata]
MATVREPPPWASAPQLDFQLFKNPTKMARSYHSLGVSVRRLLMQKSNEEGGTNFVKEVQITDSIDFVHAIPELTTTPSYFIINMIPPPDIEDHTHLHREVKLLYDASSMYKLGFSANVVWHVFKDAILPGVEKQQEEKYNVERLDFDGSYKGIGVDYSNLITGFDGQLETYKVLVDLGHATRNQIIKASCRNVVTISEPMRFPILFKLHVTNFQEGNLCAVLDAPVKKDQTYRNISSHFNDWSNYSERCRKGREQFAAECERFYQELRKDLIPGIPTFDALLTFVGLLSNKNHKKIHEQEQSAKHIKHSSVNPDDRNKGGRDEDPPSDKDENNQERRKNKDTSSAWFFESPMMPYHWIGMMTKNMVFLVMICAPADYNMQLLDDIYYNFIDALPVVSYCSENIKLLFYFTCEVCVKIIGRFIAKDHPHHKETDFFELKVDESRYIFGPIVKQRRSYSCVTRLIFSEDLEDDFEFTIMRPFNWIGPRMDFIPDTDGPREGVPRVLACFSKNLLRRETWKLADGGNSQRSYVCIKEAIDAALLLMIVCPLCFIPDTDGSREGVPRVLACFSENLLRRETWKLADGGNSQRTYVCIKEAIEAPLLMIAHDHVPGEQPLIAVSSKRIYGEGYNDRILDVTLIIKQLVGYISTVGGPSTFTAREFTEMMTYVHGSFSGEPPLEEPLIEASVEQFLGKYDDSNDKRIPGVTPNNKKQLGESPLEDPLIEVSIEQFLGEGYDDSNKRIPDVTLINKQLGWNPNDASPKELLVTALTTLQHKTMQTSCRKADVTGSIVELHNMSRSWILRRHC